MEDNSLGIFGGLFYLIIIVAVVAGWWKLFEKADKPGWAAIIPIYNLVVMHDIIGREVWKILLWFIPIVNIYFIITFYVSLAKSYGKTGIGNYLLIILLGFVAIPLWGFSDDVRYVGPIEKTGAVGGFAADNIF